jgi:hypothetical protein
VNLTKTHFDIPFKEEIVRIFIKKNLEQASSFQIEQLNKYFKINNCNNKNLKCGLLE